MADVHDKVTRSRNMSAIRASDTRPELIIRKALWQAGLRYRLHVKALPGRPDLVFPRYRAVVMVNGCFWHHHDCYLFKWPASREAFWREKITKNELNDARVLAVLREMGWRVAYVWECALKGRNKLLLPEVTETLGGWIRSDQDTLEIRGIKKA
ncbi:MULTISPECIES: very short patch repair endonuclease [Acetobacter]|mgnify:FL=1|uniref:very short patch repair endonuclease n=1 Tax=Acetobacter TaxID=434 RepID=UPI000A3A2B39|nr:MULTISPECIES: DNA mismatch endonuclease Vsr [Acetobacter]MBS0959304.1 DNA mismatch endonuclease Vsr [Acetobacter thailandicus]MBS1003678.1 DNA mismatch endonuclease Vsr [Acetobacter thailandicus]OUI87941.1 DNA glycosylase [Acetobacter sp. DmW_043]